MKTLTPDAVLYGKKVQFVFPDGLLAYDCPRCGSKCCKGYGFSGTRDELVRLGRSHAALLPFVAARKNPHEVHVENVDAGCHFLRRDQLCSLHVEGGRDAKPFTCRAFPANHLSVVGQWLFIDVNAAICPLGTRLDGHSTTIRYSEVLSDFKDACPDPAIATPTTPPENAPGELLAATNDWLKRAVIAAFDAGDWSATILDLGGYTLTRTLQQDPRAASTTILVPPPSPADRERFFVTLKMVYGLPASPSNGHATTLHRNLLAAFPTVRHTAIRAAAPKNWATFLWWLSLTPWMGLALEFLACNAMAINAERSTLETVTGIATKMPEEIAMLALTETRPFWSGVEPDHGAHVKALDPFFRELKAQSTDSPRRLGEIILIVSDDPVERALLLHDLARMSVRVFGWRA